MEFGKDLKTCNTTRDEERPAYSYFDLVGFPELGSSIEIGGASEEEIVPASASSGKAERQRSREVTQLTGLEGRASGLPSSQ